MSRYRALLSIHDVMPETLDDVEALLEAARARGHHPVTLLVVPGRDWDSTGIRRLRGWQLAGHALAGHGWSHRAVAPHNRGPGHRLHSALLSRDAAEHLSRPRSALRSLLASNHAWFAEHGLAGPNLYVPPAWALGALRPRDLAESPFELVETLTGVRQARTGRFRRIPVVGFEADTAARATALRALNAWARGRARAAGLLRIALHPADLRLRLAGDIARLLDAPLAPVGYDALLPGAPRGSPRAGHGVEPRRS